MRACSKGNGVGAFGNLANSYASNNQSYSSPGNDFYTQELAKLNKTNAAAQSLAQSIYEGASQRMDGIEQLRQRLSSASDAKDVLDLQARLQAEQAFLQTDLLRMQGLRMIQQAQVDVNMQRRQGEERRQESIVWGRRCDEHLSYVIRVSAAAFLLGCGVGFVARGPPPMARLHPSASRSKGRIRNRADAWHRWVIPTDSGCHWRIAQDGSQWGSEPPFPKRRDCWPLRALGRSSRRDLRDEVD